MSGGKCHVSDLSWTVTSIATDSHLQGEARKGRTQSQSSPRQAGYTQEVPPVPRIQAVLSLAPTPHRAPLLTNPPPSKMATSEEGMFLHWLICS